MAGYRLPRGVGAGRNADAQLDPRLAAAIDTATDAFDYLAGHDFGGLEAILGAFEAVLTQYPAPVAAAFVDGALTAWARQLDPSLRRAA